MRSHCDAQHFLDVQERLLGEDGHPRKVHEGEDPHRMGLVLEWVYGTIVSTAEKARDGAKRALGNPALCRQDGSDMALVIHLDSCHCSRRVLISC